MACRPKHKYIEHPAARCFASNSFCAEDRMHESLPAETRYVSARRDSVLSKVSLHLRLIISQHGRLRKELWQVGCCLSGILLKPVLKVLGCFRCHFTTKMTLAFHKCWCDKSLRDPTPKGLAIYVLLVFTFLAVSHFSHFSSLLLFLSCLSRLSPFHPLALAYLFHPLYLWMEGGKGRSWARTNSEGSSTRFRRGPDQWHVLNEMDTIEDTNYGVSAWIQHGTEWRSHQAGWRSSPSNKWQPRRNCLNLQRLELKNVEKTMTHDDTRQKRSKNTVSCQNVPICPNVHVLVRQQSGRLFWLPGGRGSHVTRPKSCAVPRAGP